MATGHAVTSPSLVSVGGGGKWLAYGCTADMMVVCFLKDGVTDDTTLAREADFIDAMHVLSLASGEKLSVIHMHPVKELLCVGTTHNGLYVTSASCPMLSGTASRLPVCLSGGCVFAACFVDGLAEGSDVLVVSCGLRENTTDQFRLSMWDARARTLLWRGCADALDSIVALPTTFGFATCTRQHVALWSVQRSEVRGKGSGAGCTATRGDEKSSGALTVMSKTCSAVKELEKAEYVAIVPPAANDTALSALTSAGFLISYDLRSGEPVKWMDCKVCPATAAYRSTAHIIVCGALVRFFSDNWEFRGKIRHNEQLNAANSSFLSRLMDSTCTGAAVCGGGDKFALFFSGGDMSRYRAVSAAGVSKLSFCRVYLYSPVLPDEKPLRWIPISASAMCLWSPRHLRLYDGTLRFCRSMVVDSTCAVYHYSLGVLLVYESSVYEILAIASSLEKVLCRLGVAEPLTSLLAQEENRFVGLSPGNNLFFFEGCWRKDRQHFSLVALHTTRLTNPSVPLTHLVSAAGVLCAASMHVVANLQTGNTAFLRDDIISFTAAGDFLVVVHRHCCVVMDSSLLQPVGEALQVNVELQEAVAAPGGHLVALRGEGEISVVSLRNQQLVARFGPERMADDIYPAAVMCAGFTIDDANLVSCNSNGSLTLHALSDAKTIAVVNASHTPRGRWQKQQQRQEHGGARRSLSCGGGPTSVELQSRFKDLHGFYETTRCLQRKRDGAHPTDDAAKGASVGSECTRTTRMTTRETTTSTSGVLILTQGESILQIPSASSNDHLPPLRKWDSDRAPSELPQVLGVADAADVGVSTSMVDVSALTSVESKPSFNLCTIDKSEADMSPSLAADLLLRERAKVTFTDVPAYGVRSPTRKGQPSISPMKTPEDDDVNIDSLEREIAVQPHLHCDPVAGFHEVPITTTTTTTTTAATPIPPITSGLSASMRVKSWEIRDRLRELAEAYEQRQGGDGREDDIDDETVEELFSSVNRLYARVQSRQQTRPGSAGSAASDMSSASINAVMVDLQRLQRQNDRIEAQNQEILARLLGQNGR